MDDIRNDIFHFPQDMEGTKPSDAEILEKVYANYHLEFVKYIRAFVNTQDLTHIEDILMETFTRALEHRTPLVEIRDLKPWLFVIAKHVCFEKSRSSNALPIADLEEVDSFHASDQSDQKSHVDDLEQMMMEAMPFLSKTQQIFFQYRWFEDLSNEEIAIRCQVTTQYVANQLVLARRIVKDYLQM